MRVYFIILLMVGLMIACVPAPKIIPNASAIATNFYISTTGSDTNPGTQSQPWKTIQHAVDVVNPGDTIFILGGTYNQSVRIQRSGTSTDPIKLTNYNNQVVTINGGANPALSPSGQLPQYWVVEGLRLLSSGTLTVKFDAWGCNGTCNGINHWTFRNNYISGSVLIYGSYNLFEGNEVNGTNNNGNGGNGVQDYYDVSHHNIFRNNHIHNFSVRGLWSMHRTHDNLFEGNTIHDIGQSCLDTDGFATVEWRHIIRQNDLYNCKIGMQIENTYASLIENNRIYNTTDVAISIMNYGPNITGGSFPKKCEAGGENNQYGDTNGDNNCEGNITNNIVRQNLFYNHGSGAGITIYHTGGIKLLGNTIVGSSTSQWGVRLDNSAFCPQIELQSNIITGHSAAEIILSDYASLTVDRNNLLYNITPNNIYQTKVGSTTWYKLSLAKYQAATGKGQGSRQGDPKFVNAASKDFHLLAGSLAIDSGVDTGLQFDLDNHPRPNGSGYDSGVYESSSVSQPAATSTNLQ